MQGANLFSEELAEVDDLNVQLEYKQIQVNSPIDYQSYTIQSEARQQQQRQQHENSFDQITQETHMQLQRLQQLQQQNQLQELTQAVEQRQLHQLELQQLQQLQQQAAQLHELQFQLLNHQNEDKKIHPPQMQPIPEEPSGYDEELFLDHDAAQSFVCAICTGVCHQPMETDCGHLFCAYCIKQVFAVSNQNYIFCPVDRTPLQISMIRPLGKFSSRQLCNLEMRCPAHADGCTWQAELKKIGLHFSTCEYRKVQCVACSATLMRDKFSIHQQEQCPYRLVSCEHCSKQTFFIDSDKHTSSCPKVVVPCPKCKQNIPRMELREHTKNVCELRIVGCPYAEYGCKWSGTFLDHDNHRQDAKAHLPLVVEDYAEFKRSVLQHFEVIGHPMPYTSLNPYAK